MQRDGFNYKQDSTIFLSYSSFSASDDVSFPPYTAFPLSRDIFNESSQRLVVFYIPRLLFQLNQCSHITASFGSDDSSVQVEKCGIRLVHKQDVSEFVQTLVKYMLRSSDAYHQYFSLNLMHQLRVLKDCNHEKDYCCHFSQERWSNPMPKLLLSNGTIQEECTSRETLFSNHAIAAGTSNNSSRGSNYLGIPFVNGHGGSEISSCLECWYRPYLQDHYTVRSTSNHRYSQSEIPEWFKYHSINRSVKISLPLNLYNNPDWMGFAFCAVFSFQKHPVSVPMELRSSLSFIIVCHLKTNLGCMNPLLWYGISEEDVITSLHQREFLWVSFIPYEFLSPKWSRCNSVEFSFVSDNLDVLALKCGVDLVFREKLEFTRAMVQCITSFDRPSSSCERFPSNHPNQFSSSDGYSGTSGHYSYECPYKTAALDCYNNRSIFNQCIPRSEIVEWFSRDLLPSDLSPKFDFHPSTSYNFCFPPSEIQDWFSHPNHGHSVTIDLPSNLYHDSNWMGLVLYASFSIHGDSNIIFSNLVSGKSHFLYCQCQMSTANVDNQTIAFSTNKEEITWLLNLGEFIWICYVPGEPFKNMLPHCSHIEASFVSDWPGVIVQNCALQLLYQHEQVQFEQELKHCNNLISQKQELVRKQLEDQKKINEQYHVDEGLQRIIFSNIDFEVKIFPRLIDQPTTDETETQLGQSDLLLVQPRTETMARALVGGAVLSAFLQVAFDRAASREVLDYLNGRKLIDRLVQKLKLELMSAGAVLNDAEEKQITDPAVKKWLDELKDAVYVADDLLDEIAYEAMRCKLEAESTSTSKVMGFLSTFVNSFDRRIQSELENILEQLESITKQKDVLRLEKVATAAQVPSRPLTTSCPEEYGVFGRDRDMEAIFDMFQSDDASVNGIRVVPIVGMGGVGKTTLARLIYNDKRVEESFDLKAWVCVSENYDYFRIAKAIFEEVTSSACDIQTMNLLQNKIREKFKEKKVFLVLDDVRNENYNDWVEFVKAFILGAREIKIIVTTRSIKVALKVGTISSYILNELSTEECWLLFKKHAFKNGSSGEFPILEEIGRKIVQKCRGLPLAAKALGGLLRFEENPIEWTKILKSDIWDLPKGNINILPALRLSYHYLPPHLKRCFAYCSILPKDYEFKKEELLLLWMAEDLLQQYEGNGMMEEIGEQYFDDLVSRSFFQRSSSNQSCFVMHDLVNDLAIFISGEFCFQLENNESCVITRKTRHLSYVRTEYDSSKKFKMSYEAKDLRTFLGLDLSSDRQYFNRISTMMIDDLLLTSKCLRVLSFSSYSNMRELPNSIGNLKYLRYLDLSYTSIKWLPNSLCNLYKLQTLLLANCESLLKLPSKMWRLVNLRHLDLVGTKLKEMPLHMGKLKNLVKLTTFVVGKHSGSSIKELGELHHLSGALSILNLQNVHHARDAREVNLKDRQYLSELVFQCGFDNENSEKERHVLEQLCPHSKLESLTIEDYGGTKFPTWLEDCSFSNMVSIRLANCKYCSSLPSIGHLPVLKRLYVEGFHFVSYVDREFYGDGSSIIKPFRSLEVLSFRDMPEWREWFLFEGEHEDGVGVFCTLKELCIIECPKLSGGLPSQLPSLIKLEIAKCQQLVASVPRAPTLNTLQLSDCDKVVLTGINTAQHIVQSLNSLVRADEDNEDNLIDPEAMDELREIEMRMVRLQVGSLSLGAGSLFPSAKSEAGSGSCEWNETNPDPPLNISLLFPSNKSETDDSSPEFSRSNSDSIMSILPATSPIDSPKNYEIIFRNPSIPSYYQCFPPDRSDTDSNGSSTPNHQPSIPSYYQCFPPDRSDTDSNGSSTPNHQPSIPLYYYCFPPDRSDTDSYGSSTPMQFSILSLHFPPNKSETINSSLAINGISLDRRILPPKLDYLCIKGGRIFLQSFAELLTCLAVKSLDIEGTFQITTGHYYPSLERLRIRDDSDSLWSFPLESYPKLKSLTVLESKNLESLFVSEESYRDLSSLTHLTICSSPNFVSFFSGGICATNLISISISDCKKLKSLPENMRTLFPSLEYLEVSRCPKLESFAEGGLPLNLATLCVSYCDKLFSGGLQDLHSLREIRIHGDNCKEVESFPEEALLAPTLTDIKISSFPKLKSLKGFQHLTSLKTLDVRFCDNLQYLPEEGFPTSLSSLIIDGCPLLKQRCKREKGKEWPKIAHIPNIVIDDELIE